ncbi:MAG: hypothetical protein H0V93_05785 [Euzebyales bacterium]|nr:hypothetical protein [Euzebyales bacterium]
MMATVAYPKGALMGIVILLVILALVVGGIGLVIEGLQLLLIVALVLFIASFVLGRRGRTKR